MLFEPFEGRGKKGFSFFSPDPASMLVLTLVVLKRLAEGEFLFVLFPSVPIKPFYTP